MGNEYTLKLDQFCIETTAKRERERLQNEVLENDHPAPEAEQALELLRVFLEQEDFRSIRSAHPDLCGGTPVRVRIFEDPAGRVRWTKL